MKAKSTDEIEKALGNTHTHDASKFLTENEGSMLSDEFSFANYMRETIKKKNILQQEVFLRADIPERYGYKLISQEKRTKQRDIILRLCYAAEFTLKETQEALKIYGMPELYARIPRDALLIIAFNERPGSILDVNSFLKKNDVEPLRSSGTID